MSFWGSVHDSKLFLNKKKSHGQKFLHHQGCVNWLDPPAQARLPSGSPVSATLFWGICGSGSQSKEGAHVRTRGGEPGPKVNQL